MATPSEKLAVVAALERQRLQALSLMQEEEQRTAILIRLADAFRQKLAELETMLPEEDDEASVFSADSTNASASVAVMRDERRNVPPERTPPKPQRRLRPPTPPPSTVIASPPAQVAIAERAANGPTPTPIRRALMTEVSPSTVAPSTTQRTADSAVVDPGASRGKDTTVVTPRMTDEAVLQRSQTDPQHTSRGLNASPRPGLLSPMRRRVESPRRRGGSSPRFAVDTTRTPINFHARESDDESVPYDSTPCVSSNEGTQESVRVSMSAASWGPASPRAPLHADGDGNETGLAAPRFDASNSHHHEASTARQDVSLAEPVQANGSPVTPHNHLGTRQPTHEGWTPGTDRRPPPLDAMQSSGTPQVVRDEFDSAWDFVIHVLGDLTALETVDIPANVWPQSSVSATPQKPAVVFSTDTSGAIDVVTPLRFDGAHWTVNTLSLAVASPAPVRHVPTMAYDYLRVSPPPATDVESAVDLEGHARAIRNTCRAIVQEATAYADQRLYDNEFQSPRKGR